MIKQWFAIFCTKQANLCSCKQNHLFVLFFLKFVTNLTNEQKKPVKWRVFNTSQSQVAPTTCMSFTLYLSIYDKPMIDSELKIGNTNYLIKGINMFKNQIKSTLCQVFSILKKVVVLYPGFCVRGLIVVIDYFRDLLDLWTKAKLLPIYSQSLLGIDCE